MSAVIWPGLFPVKIKNLDVNRTGAAPAKARSVPWRTPSTTRRVVVVAPRYAGEDGAREPSILVLRGAAERGSNGDRPKGRPEGRPSVDGLWGGGGGSAAGGFGSHPAPSHEARRSR